MVCLGIEASDALMAVTDNLSQLIGNRIIAVGNADCFVFRNKSITRNGELVRTVIFGTNLFNWIQILFNKNTNRILVVVPHTSKRNRNRDVCARHFSSQIRSMQWQLNKLLLSFTDSVKHSQRVLSSLRVTFFPRPTSGRSKKFYKKLS